MSARLEELARTKQVLLMRSALGRLRLQRDALVLRNSLRGSGMGLAARLLVGAPRVILTARLARTALGFARRFIPARYVRTRTDKTKNSP